MTSRGYYFRLPYNKSKVYKAAESSYPFSLIKAEEVNIKFMNSDSVLNEFNNRIISTTERIIKTPIQKKRIAGVYDYYDYNDNKYVFLLSGNNKSALVYSHKIDNENAYDTYKIVYNYEFINHSPYSMKVTGIDEENSYYVISETTAKTETYGCTKYESGNHKFTDKICNKDIKLPDVIKYDIPFTIQYYSEHLVINNKQFYLQSDYSNKLMERMIDSPLVINPITSFSYERDSYEDSYEEYIMEGFTPGYYYNLNYNDGNEKKCTVNIRDIKEFKDENDYTIIQDKKDDSVIRYCFNVSFDDYNVYCYEDKSNNWLIEVYMDYLNKYPKIRIYI